MRWRCRALRTTPDFAIGWIAGRGQQSPLIILVGILPPRQRVEDQQPGLLLFKFCSLHHHTVPLWRIGERGCRRNACYWRGTKSHSPPAGVAGVGRVLIDGHLQVSIAHKRVLAISQIKLLD